jgi:hypothetical protein
VINARTGRVLRAWNNGNGYMQGNPCKNGRTHTYYVKDVHGWPQSKINDFWAHLKDIHAKEQKQLEDAKKDKKLSRQIKALDARQAEPPGRAGRQPQKARGRNTAAVPTVVSPPLDNAQWKALNAIQLATRYTSTLSTLDYAYTTAPLAVPSTA